MKKEDFFEVLGELDEKLVKGAEKPVKKKNNWKIWGGVAACLAVAAILGMGLLQSNGPADEEPAISMKPVINFEGVVEAVDGEKIILKDGKVIRITEDTVFMGDPDLGNAVSEEILAGNFIQGYTEDADAEEIIAGKIWTNDRPSSGGKRVINFEGRVVKAGSDQLTLDTGKIVHLTADTAVTAPDGSAAEVAEGDYIQGYAEDAEADEVTAQFILVTPL